MDSILTNRITRDKLAKVFTNQEAIKLMENLTRDVGTTVPNSLTEIQQMAQTALMLAGQALLLVGEGAGENEPGPPGNQGLTGPVGPSGPAVYLEASEMDEPVFVGGPTAPVTASVAWSAPVTKTADFTLAPSEAFVINNKAAATCTVTLPAASTVPGKPVTFQNYQAFTLVSASGNVVPIGGGAAGTAILAASIGDWAMLVSDGTNWVVLAAAPNNILLLE